MKDRLSGNQLSLNCGSSATIDPKVNLSGSIVGGSILGGSIFGGSIVAVPFQ